MDTKENILSRIIPGISEALGVDSTEIASSTTFEDLGADSLDIIELIMAAETEFNIRIGDEAFEQVRTIEDAIQMIQQCQIEAAEKARKKQEELDKKLAEFGPVRLGWEMLEEQQSKEYISKTGLPYFIFDGSPSKLSESVEKFNAEEDDAITSGRHFEWLLEKVSWFMGRPIKELSIESISDIIAFYQSIDFEKPQDYIHDRFSRFGYGCHYVVLPNGEKREMKDMLSLGSQIIYRVLTSSIKSQCPETFQIIRTNKNGNAILSCNVIDAMYCCGTWTISLRYNIEGKGRTFTTQVLIDPHIGGWTSKDDKTEYNAINSISAGHIRSISSFIHKVNILANEKFLLERVSFKFGIQAKSITPSLAHRGYMVNKKCVKFCDIGKPYMTIDGRAYSHSDTLNDSVCIYHKILSQIIANEKLMFMMKVNGKSGSFLPNRFVAYYLEKNSIILQGCYLGDDLNHTETFEISLDGQKSYRARESFFAEVHIKGDIEFPDSHVNRKMLSYLTSLMEKVYGKRQMNLKKTI